MRGWWGRNRLGLLLGGALVLALALLALAVGGNGRGTLDPDGYDPSGAHALAVLLRDNGVTVERTTDVPATVDRAAGATVFVPMPELLSPQELHLLAGAPGRLVVAGADDLQLAALDAPARTTGTPDTRDRDPGCTLPVATNAGRALAGGVAYAPSGADGQSCYGSSLVDVPGRQLDLLGDPAALTNAHLGEEGNAALGIGLLGSTGKVVWLVPAADRPVLGTPPATSPDDLLPGWVLSARGWLLLALVVVAVWRGRRLGRVVTEDLPVVVRAAETVEGHGRLYQAAGARSTAAEALRGAALRSLARLTHGGEAPAPDALVALVADRAGRDAATVHRLLYGPPPADDDGLVRLASQLDALTHDALDR